MRIVTHPNKAWVQTRCALGSAKSLTGREGRWRLGAGGHDACPLVSAVLCPRRLAGPDQVCPQLFWESTAEQGGATELGRGISTVARLWTRMY